MFGEPGRPHQKVNRLRVPRLKSTVKNKASSCSRTEHATRQLRRRIIDGESEPGTLLAECAVARELGVSRVPVREALFALERDGLVEFSASGRAYVKDLSPRDFEELYVLRLTLEPLGAKLASPSLRADSRALAKNIEATGRATSLGRVTALDLDFHELVLEASGNGRLLKLWRFLRCELELWLGRMHRSRHVRIADIREETVRNHRQMLECFSAETPAICEKKMRAHLLGWREWLPMDPRASEAETTAAAGRVVV